MKRKKYAYLFATTVLLANVATTPMTVIAETMQENPASEVAEKAEKQEKSQEEPSNSAEVKQEQPQEVPESNGEKVEEGQSKEETPVTPEETPVVENEEKAPEGATNAEVETDAGTITNQEVRLTDWETEDKGSYVLITKYTGSSTEIVVPNEIEGKPTKLKDIDTTVFPSLLMITSSGPKKFKVLPREDGTKVGLESTDLSDAFRELGHLKEINLTGLDTSNVTNFSDMFRKCSGLTSLDVSNWDVRNATTLSNIFSGCSGLTSLDVSNWDVRNATTLSNIFSGCSGLTSLDVSNWDVRNATTLSNIFSGCSGLTSLDVSNWNVSNATTLSGIFQGCSGLTSLDVSNWDVRNATTLSGIFSGCSGLTSLDVSNWNVSNATTLSGIFQGCSGLTSLDVSNWDVSNATRISAMFNDCSSLTSLDVSNWDVSNVQLMTWLFQGCSNLTSLDLSNWHVNKLGGSSMSLAFEGCSNLKFVDLSNFDTSSAPSYGMSEIFQNIPELLVITNDEKLKNYDYSKDGVKPLSTPVLDANGGQFEDRTNTKQYFTKVAYTSEEKINEGITFEQFQKDNVPTKAGTTFRGWKLTEGNDSGAQNVYPDLYGAKYQAQWAENMGEPVTVKYVFEETGKEIASSKTIEGEVGESYDATTPEYKLNIDGYVLNESRLPDNAKGTFSKEAKEVVYYYKALQTSIVNGSFEDPVIDAGNYEQFFQTIPGWKSLHDRVFRLNQQRPGAVPAIDGKQWVELQTVAFTSDFGIYQDVKTTPGETLYWEVSQRGVYGEDTAAIQIGAPDGELVEQKQVTSPHTEWKTYSGYYTVPEGQTTTRFQLKSIRVVQPWESDHGNFFDKVIFTNIKSTVKVNFVDKSGKPIKEPQIVTGYKGQSYDLTDIVETPISDYKLDESKLPEGIKGTFTDEDKELTLVYKQEGTVNVKYIFEGNDQEIAPSQTLIGERGEQYDVSTEQYKLDLTSKGYHLDEERLPENATGTFAKEPTEVVYYYKAVSTSLINGGFERPVIDTPSVSNGHHCQYYTNGQVPGWFGQNGRIQLQTDSTVIPAIEGKQWVEINTSGVGIYQDVATTPGDKLYWEFYYRGALNTASAAVDIGASEGKLVEQMQITTGTDAWKKYSGFYIVPEGQTKTRFQLRNINGYAGNVFDAVVFTNEKAIVTIKYVNERGEEIKASEEKHGWEGERYDYTKEITDTVIPGYAIDTEKMPSNIKGAFTREDQVITVHYKTVNVNIPSQDVDNMKPEETSLFGIAYMPKQFQTGKTVLNDSGPQSIPVNKTDRFDVGVRDLRNKENQWTLSAQLVWSEGKELPGSFIKTTNSTGTVMKNVNNGTDPFNPDRDLMDSNDGVQGGTNVEITKVPTSIMTANMGKYNAVYNYNLGDVSLEIPEAGMVEPGSYSGNVVWSLENVLGNETTPPVEKQYSFKVNEYLSPQRFNSYEEAEEARHNYVMENFKRGSREPTSMVTNSEHGNLDIPEEYLKYKYRVVFYVSAILPPGASNPEVVSDKKFVTYQQAENYLEECIQRINIIYVPSLGAYTEVSSVKESSVTNLQGEDISGPIE